jgi:parallel beta-helix repeat protein
MKPGSSYSSQFVCSAIHLIHVHNILIDKVVIRRYPSDGFSIQGGSNASVTNCLAEYNLGNGFHPGTTLTGSTWSQNTGRYNGGDGLYFCFNVRYATVADNHFHNNKRHGIGDLGKGGDYGDQMNVVSGNFCYNNDQCGIELTPGGNNIVVNNICENNSRAEPGRWPGISLRDTHSTIIQGNRCVQSNQPASGGRQNHGIFLAGKCENNLIMGNIITGYQVGIHGENMDKNTILQNVSVEKHQPEDPKK